MSNPPSDLEEETSEPPFSAGRNQRARRIGKGMKTGGRQATGDTAEVLSTRPSGTDELLRVLIGLMGRVAFPQKTLRTIVRGPGKAGDKYVKAYNLCDGTRAMREVARLADLDSSNMSKAISRWVEAGVAFKLGSDSRPVQLYRLTNAEAEEESDEDSDSPSEAIEQNGKPRRDKTVRTKNVFSAPDTEPELELPFVGAGGEPES